MKYYLTAQQLVDYTKAMTGESYVYGCWGQVGSEQLYEEKLTQYPDQVGKWPKSTYTSIYGKRWMDCIGMIKGAAGAHGDPNVIPTYGDIKEIDWSANETIKRCTDVVAFSEIPEVPGMLVWKNGHVGVFIRTLSDGRKLVREAKGHMYGVVETTDTKWIKAGKLPYVDYTTKQEMCTVKLPVLRSGSKGQAVKTLQACLDIEGYGLKIDGSFGPATSKAVIDWKSKNDPKLGSTDEVNTYTWTYLLN